MSTPFMLPGLLVGGLVPGPWLETGDRIGDGERFNTADGSEVRPARFTLSRDTVLARVVLCSDWTTSANEIKDRRRTSEDSSDP